MSSKTLHSPLLLLFVFLSFLSIQAQSYCIPDRFSETDYFPPSDILTLTNETYGMALDSGGVLRPLLYDLYMPNPAIDSLVKRPFIFMVHGGSWNGGTKSDLESSARYFAGKGYVCASIDYRVGWDWDSASVDCTGDSLGYAEARLRAIQDCRASLRYFSHFADSFRIDSNAFIAYGGSAGAGIIMESIFLDPAEFENLFGADLVMEHGGADATGNLFTEGYKIIASRTDAANMNDTSFIGPNDEIPGIYFHGTADSTVLYTSGARGSCDNEEYGFMYGSRSITQRLGNLGTCYELNFEVGAPHGALYTTNYLRTHTTCFLKNVLCGTCTTHEFDSAAPPCLVLDLPAPMGQLMPAKIYPQPVRQGQDIKVELPDLNRNTWGYLLDLQGRKLRQFEMKPGQIAAINLEGLPHGLYLLQFEHGQTERILIIPK